MHIVLINDVCSLLYVPNIRSMPDSMVKEVGKFLLISPIIMGYIDITDYAWYESFIIDGCTRIMQYSNSS